MNRLSYILIFVFVPAIFAGLFYLVPPLTKTPALLSLIAVFAVPWSIIVMLVRGVNSLANVEALGARERDHLAARVHVIHRRSIYVAAFVLACGLFFLVLAFQQSIKETWLIGLLAGILIAAALSYTIRTVHWYLELQRFISDIRRREHEKKERDALLRKIKSTKLVEHGY